MNSKDNSVDSSSGSSPESFSAFALAAPIQRAIEETGYITPTPIQAQAIPLVNEGHDLLGIAQTGTGKTAAFCLPILNILYRHKMPHQSRAPRVLILTPTRELAIQIHKSCLEYGKHLHQKYAVIFGGVGQMGQVRDLARGVDILVATPGRLLDLVNQNHLRLGSLEIFVLDEADRMLDMGFMKDVKKIVALLPAERQNLFFSATMPPEIQNLAHSILRHPKKVEVTPPATTVEKIHQEVFFVDKENKINLLVHILKDQRPDKVLVFASMKHLANKISDRLTAQGISSAAIHGNKSQGARQKALEDFTRGRVHVLVATDLASRGIDVDGITHVINYDLPNIPESYVHRIGRTARAGASGKAISFCTAEEKSYLVAIERTTRRQVEVVTTQPFHSENAQAARITSVGKAKALIEGQRERHPGGHRGGGRGGHGGGRGGGQHRGAGSGQRLGQPSHGQHHGQSRSANGNQQDQGPSRHDPRPRSQQRQGPQHQSHGRPAHSSAQAQGQHRSAPPSTEAQGNSSAPSGELKRTTQKRRRFGWGSKPSRK